MISAAQMLPGLIAAWTDYYHGNQARKLVHQIAWFCHWADADKTLEALGAPPASEEDVTGLQDADVTAALLSLHQLSQRRLAERKERKERQEQQATALTAEERALLAAYKDPRLFQTVVDGLPPGRARVTLKLWGMLHRAYPISDETRGALFDEAAQAMSAETTGTALDSADQAPVVDRDPGWDF